MTVYIALVDGKAGAYGVSFPDLPGCVAMGASIDEAIAEATEVLRVWVAEKEAAGEAVPAPTPLERLHDMEEAWDQVLAGSATFCIPLLRSQGRAVKANLSLDAAVLAAIDAAAERHGITRSAMVERLAMQHLAMVG